MFEYIVLDEECHTETSLPINTEKEKNVALLAMKEWQITIAKIYYAEGPDSYYSKKSLMDNGFIIFSW